MVMKSRTSAHDNQIDKYFDTDFQKEMLTFVDTNDIDCIFSQVQLKIIEQLSWISKKVLSHRQYLSNQHQLSESMHFWFNWKPVFLFRNPSDDILIDSSILHIQKKKWLKRLEWIEG